MTQESTIEPIKQLKNTELKESKEQNTNMTENFDTIKHCGGNTNSKTFPTSAVHKESDNAVFKPPPSPKASPARPLSHPSPSSSSLPSFSYSSLPSPKYLSLPNLLSPMPATPKSHDDTDKDKDVPNNGRSISKEMDQSAKTNMSSNGDGSRKSNKLEKVVLGIREKSDKSQITKCHNDKPLAVFLVTKPDEIGKSIALPDGPYPRRRGGKSKAKKFGQDVDKYSSEQKYTSESDTEELHLTMAPPLTPPKRSRGRPPKSLIETENTFTKVFTAVNTQHKSGKDDFPIITTSPETSQERDDETNQNFKKPEESISEKISSNKQGIKSGDKSGKLLYPKKSKDTPPKVIQLVRGKSLPRGLPLRQVLTCLG